MYTKATPVDRPQLGYTAIRSASLHEMQTKRLLKL